VFYVRQQQQQRAHSLSSNTQSPPLPAVVAHPVGEMPARARYFAFRGRDRNQDQSAAYRLPNEILSMIFELVIELTTGPIIDEVPRSVYCPEQPLIKKRFETIIAVMSVSSLWKNIVMETPRLWSRIHSGLPIHALEAFLRRSKYASLDVYWIDRPSGTPSSEFAGMLLPHRHRLQSLLINGAREIEKLLLAPASVSKGSTSSKSLGSSEIAKANTLGKLHPALDPGTIPFYSRLTKLHLYFIHLETHTVLSILRVLEASPLLQSLYMETFSCRPIEKSFEPLSSVIDLPCLRSLRISHTDAWVTHYVLAHIKIPLSAKLYLRVGFKGARLWRTYCRDTQIPSLICRI